MGIKNYVEKNQPLLSKTFSLAIKGNRIAHAYLLLGEPGIPLKEIAIFMAKSILCDHGDPLADETCNTCKRIEEGEYPDLIICNGEESSIKKEDVGLVTSSFIPSSMASFSTSSLGFRSNLIDSHLEIMVGNILASLLEVSIAYVFGVGSSRNFKIELQSSPVIFST